MLTVKELFKLHQFRRPVAEMATGASCGDDYGSSTRTGLANDARRLPLA